MHWHVCFLKKNKLELGKVVNVGEKVVKKEVFEYLELVEKGSFWHQVLNALVAVSSVPSYQ